jgi:ferric-dicitrate binding protein FerR (iron transport regulator)
MTEWPDNIREALGRLLDGEYEPEDPGLLVAWLKENPDERAAIHELFDVDGLLQVNADFDPAAFVAGVETRIAAESGESEFVDGLAKAIDAEGTPSRGRWQALPWLLAAAAGIALVLTNLPESAPSIDQPQQVGADPAPIQPTNLAALLVNAVDAEFVEGASPDGFRFEPGTYALQSGAVHLRFTNGVDLVARAPAEFVIEDAMRMQLAKGSVRAFVPEEGHGFSIDVPGAVYEDIGTEFGVQVEGDSSELHVFSGSVKVHRDQQSKLYEMGQSVRVGVGGVSAAAAPDLSLYLTPADLNYLRWQRMRDELPTSPGLIAYLPFDQPGTELSNLAGTDEVSDGRLVQARWVTGRWAKKPALLFDVPGDRVELDFKRAYTQATLSLWCKVDRVDVPHTSLVSSDGAEKGDIHWKIDRDGRTDLALHGLDGWRQLRGPTVPFGQWLHLVAAMDLENGRLAYYVNGKRVGEGRMPVREFAPGSVRIGDWLPEEGHPLVTRARGFHGRIGEFAAWNRVLSEDEIRAMWGAGTPDVVGLER